MRRFFLSATALSTNSFQEVETLAALFLLAQAFLPLCGCAHLRCKDICKTCQRRACLFQRVGASARVGRGPQVRLLVGRRDSESPLLLFFCFVDVMQANSRGFGFIQCNSCGCTGVDLPLSLAHIRHSCALSHSETPEELCWFFFSSVECGREIHATSCGFVTTSNSDNGAVLPS